MGCLCVTPVTRRSCLIEDIIIRLGTGSEAQYDELCELPVARAAGARRRMKVKSALRRLCLSCYFVRRQGRLFVYCKENPRHKQRQGRGPRRKLHTLEAEGAEAHAMGCACPAHQAPQLPIAGLFTPIFTAAPSTSLITPQPSAFSAMATFVKSSVESAQRWFSFRR